MSRNLKKNKKNVRNLCNRHIIYPTCTIKAQYVLSGNKFLVFAPPTIDNSKLCAIVLRLLYYSYIKTIRK